MKASHFTLLTCCLCLEDVSRGVFQIYETQTSINPNIQKKILVFFIQNGMDFRHFSFIQNGMDFRHFRFYELLIFVCLSSAYKIAGYIFHSTISFGNQICII